MRSFAGGPFIPEVASQTLFSLTAGQFESQAVESFGPLAKYSAFTGAKYFGNVRKITENNKTLLIGYVEDVSSAYDFSV
jgi:hypothetical protein